MLGLRLLWRDWRGGELGILLLSVVIAVSIVTGISLFAERLQQGISAQSSHFLAADRVLKSPRQVPSAWLDYAQQRGLQQAQVMTFSSMVFVGDAMHLASVKAVSDSYPLLGELEVSEQAYTSIYKTTKGPGVGEAWLESRLFSLLAIAIGDQIHVGDAVLRVSRVIINEPDRGGNFYSFGPRVLMHIDDIPATNIVQPGSRVSYRYLFAGDRQIITNYEQWLKPQLSPSHQWRNVKDSQPRIAVALERAQKFLLLAGALGVGLAGIAIALAARRYSERHYDYVAMMKSLGANSNNILIMYSINLIVLAMIGTLLGWGTGWLIQSGFIALLQDYFAIGAAPTVTIKPFIVGAVTAVVCLIAFALPAFASLRNVSPLRVIRRDFEAVGLNTLFSYSAGIGGISLLMWWYSGDIRLTLTLVSAVTLTFVLVGVIAWCLLRTGSLVGMQAGSVFRLALASMRRRGYQNAVQVVIFSLSITLLLILGLVRTSLIEEWQLQLPEGTPNHFLINIAEPEVALLTALLKENNVASETLFPLVRGRLTHINDVVLNKKVSKEKAGSPNIDRELSLTWTDKIPFGNTILSGRWWSATTTEAEVSVEAKLATSLNIQLGDKLDFQIGSEILHVSVTSIRELDWDTMRPNFYMIFPPNVLQSFAATYMTSFYLPSQEKSFLNQLLIQFPTVAVIEMDSIIGQIRKIVNQVSSAIELVLGLIIISGLLVLIASVQASLDSRYQESAILRTLGARRSIVMGSLVLEFGALGLLAGGLAAAAAELSVMALQTWVLQMSYNAHPWVWVIAPLLGMLLISGAGYFTCRKVVNRPPIEVLRAL